MHQRHQMTGVILSGGKSLRMGEDKAFLKIEGVPIIRRISTLFNALFQETIIVTNREEFYEELGIRTFPDIIPNMGALGGLYTGLTCSTFYYVFCVACDMPFIKQSLVSYLIQEKEGYDVVVPRTKDGFEPLHAVYSKACIPPTRQLLVEGCYKILDLYPLVKVKTIECSEMARLDPKGESFINVNTPEELQRIRSEKHPIE